jgi:hypothetical protein
MTSPPMGTTTPFVAAAGDTRAEVEGEVHLA